MGLASLPLENTMLFNSRQQLVTLSLAQMMVCTHGLQDLTDGKINTNDIKARRNILFPLRETKQQSNPCGRGTVGMFSINTRAKFIGYNHLYGNGRRERFVLTN